MKQLIICPICDGRRREYLAELLPTGFLVVERTRVEGKRRRTTVIYGKEIKLMCGKCGNLAYQKYGTNSQIIGTSV